MSDLTSSEIIITMAPDYKLYKGSHVLSVKHEYLLKCVNRTLEEVIEEISWTASYLDCMVITTKTKVIIQGKDCISVMTVLLTKMEMQLLKNIRLKKT